MTLLLLIDSCGEQRLARSTRAVLDCRVEFLFCFQAGFYLGPSWRSEVTNRRKFIFGPKISSEVKSQMQQSPGVQQFCDKRLCGHSACTWKRALERGWHRRLLTDLEGRPTWRGRFSRSARTCALRCRAPARTSAAKCSCHRAPPEAQRARATAPTCYAISMFTTG